MTKEQVYEELENTWKLFKIKNKEINKTTIKEKLYIEKIYLIEYILDQMVKNKNISREMALEIHNEIVESWKEGE